jgi:lipid-A-disaccharide synthase-like uncharacterized protein
MKYGSLIAMAAMLLLGGWLIWGPLTRIDQRTWPDSRLLDILVAGDRGVLEAHRDPASGLWAFRTHMRNGFTSPILTPDQVEMLIGPDGLANAIASHHPVLDFFNITSWTNLVWVSVGLAGQLAFSGRMIVQWLISEKRKTSTVPVAFWWLSLFGGLCLFTYFIWRQDFVGILGQAPGVVIYARNLHLIHRPRHPAPAPP